MIKEIISFQGLMVSAMILCVKGDTIKSIFPILTEGQSQQSKVTLAVICFFRWTRNSSFYGW